VTRRRVARAERRLSEGGGGGGTGGVGGMLVTGARVIPAAMVPNMQ